MLFTADSVPNWLRILEDMSAMELEAVLVIDNKVPESENKP